MSGSQATMFANLLPLALILFIFYFILIKPQQKQQQDFKKMIERLQKNDQIVTMGGIHGTIVNVKEKTFVVRIDDNTRIEIDKTAVARLEKISNETK
jgi:preprotein translocase subunit YajC